MSKTTNTIYSQRNVAIIVGAFFLIALVFALIASAIMDPILTVDDYLARAYPNKTSLIIGNLLNLICAFAMIFIPILLFPILRKYNEYLARGYMAMRFIEGILYIYIPINSFSLINLSQEYLGSDTRNVSYVQFMGKLVQARIEWAIATDILFFTLGAMMFYFLLYKSKLVPRWLSAWGFSSAIVLFMGLLLSMFGVFGNMELMEAMMYFAPPIALNEFTLSLWLIIKGFNSSTFAGIVESK